MSPAVNGVVLIGHQHIPLGVSGRSCPAAAVAYYQQLSHQKMA